MNRTDLISERAFALLLERRGIPFVPEDRLEQAVAIREGKRPDFCLTVGPPHVLAEVTELTKPGPLDGLEPGYCGAIDPRLITKRMRNEIGDEMPQLRPYGEAGHPTIIVLANPKHFFFPMDPYWLLQVFGEMTLTMPFDGSRLDEDGAVIVHMKNKVLSDRQGTILSALAVLRGLPRPRLPGEPPEALDPSWLHLRVVHNPHARIRIDTALFVGPEDQNIVYDHAAQVWIDAKANEPVRW